MADDYPDVIEEMDDGNFEEIIDGLFRSSRKDIRGWLSDVLDFDDAESFCTLDDLYDEYKLQAGTSGGLTIRGATKTIKSKLKAEAIKLGAHYGQKKTVDGKRLRVLIGCKLNKTSI